MVASVEPGTVLPVVSVPAARVRRGRLDEPVAQFHAIENENENHFH